jgi:hypothetical protein
METGILDHNSLIYYILIQVKYNSELNKIVYFILNSLTINYNLYKIFTHPIM